VSEPLFARVQGDPARPALVLLHGSGQAGRMWRRQLDALSDRFHVIAPDLPGFGRSPGPFTMAGAVAGVARLATEHAPAHLCGLSMGTLVAAGVAAERPELVNRLVLAGPVIAPARSGPHLLRRYRRWPGALVRVISDVHGRPGWLAMLDELESTDVTAQLPQISAPTLALCGARDRAALPDAHAVAAAVPGARLAVVPHAGHLLPGSAPKAFHAILGGFLG
jgi:3-oxoadipate enol-lactonase